MKNKTLFVLGMFVFFGLTMIWSPVSGAAASVELPGYYDYCPGGMPDFDQRQGGDYWKKNNHWTLCGTCAAANVLWYLDSRRESIYPYPECNLVPTCCCSNPRCPWFQGCASGDHATNNPPRLIENIVIYTKTDTWQGGQVLNMGTNPDAMKEGLEDWISDRGLSSDYYVIKKSKPSFDYLKSQVDNGNGVLLNMYIPWISSTKKSTWHWVAVAGYETQPNKFIISDPFGDDDLRDLPKPPPPGNDWTVYWVRSDADSVSHDTFDVAVSYWPGAQIQLIHYWREFDEDCHAHIITAIIVQDNTW